MAKLVQKSGYIKSGKAGGYMRYIATREGVERLAGNGAVTKGQRELIQKLLTDFPDAVELFEYEDYCKTPTLGTASTFITMALDANLHEIDSESGYMQYIAKAIYHPQIPLRCITVQVDQEFIDQYLQEISGDLEVNFSDFFKEKGKFYLPNVNHAMQSLYEYLLSMKASRITVEAKIYEIISYLASYLKENRLNEENGQPINKTDLQALAELTHYMDEHYSFNITLQTLSTIACMSESKMKKLFKSVYNMSITEYIQRKRISVAEHMLIQTDLTIAEISRIVGYSNPSRLIEIFKRYYGFTPSKYRK